LKPLQFDLKEAVKDNESYRKVIFTGAHSQLVLMALPPGSEIGLETHPVDQFFYVVDGKGVATIEGRDQEIEKGDAVCVPADQPHNIANSGDEPLKLFTVYSPPQHPSGLEQKVKPEPVAALIL
jgi:mannose-6-phosphate isomerase-like protein (cupin superfamily)